jgi:hypothetical protein
MPIYISRGRFPSDAVNLGVHPGKSILGSQRIARA